MTVSMLEMRQAAWLPALFSCNKYHLCFTGLNLFLCVAQRGMLYIVLSPIDALHKSIDHSRSGSSNKETNEHVKSPCTVTKRVIYSYSCSSLYELPKRLL